MRNFRACAALVAAMSLFGLRAASAEAEPSISEMLATIRSTLDQKPAPAAPAPHEAGGGRVRRPASPPAPSSEAKVVLKKLEVLAGDVLKYYQRKNDQWEMALLYARLEKYSKAASLLDHMYRKRDAGNGGNRGTRVTWGILDLEYACVLTELGGRTQAVAQAMATHEALWDKAYAERDDRHGPWYGDIQRVKRGREFVKGYAEAKEKLADLTASLAESPDGDKQWELAETYRPDNARVVAPLSWLKALLDMKARYPDHQRVTSGDADWLLHWAYTEHQMYEDAIELLARMIEAYPEADVVKRGDCLWEMAFRYENLGEFLVNVRQDGKNAVAAYGKARETFEKFKADYPDDGKCQAPKGGGAAWVNACIARVSAALTRAKRLR